MAEEFVKVQVIARQMVSYKQTLTFTRKDWEAFKKQNTMDAGDEIGDRLDLRDIHDGDPIEDFEAVVVGDDKKPVSPLDEYGL